MQSIIKKLSASVAQEALKVDPLFKDYLKIFYYRSSANDFSKYPNYVLTKACLQSFEFFANKPKNTFKIKIYNPTIEDNGFEADFTILDVLNDDAPFLVDSLVMYFDKNGIEVKNIIHPIFSTKRSENGDLQALINSQTEGNQESIIQLHLAHISSAKELKEIESSLKRIFETVHLIVHDWKKMINAARQSKEQLNNAKSSTQDLEEFRNFIDWLCVNSFIFLGSCEYDLINNQLEPVKDSAHGIFKSKHDDIRPKLVDYSSGDVEDLVKNPYYLEILKSRYRSIIHRPVNAERIRVQKFDNNGKVIGEYRFIGLFTSSVYYQSADLIPIIRKKIARVMKEASFKPGGHSYKDLASTLESYPRDELFQIEHEDLLRISLGIVAMSGRPLVRFFARHDKFQRFVSCLIFIPRDHFNTYVKEEVHNLLGKAYGGEILGSYIQVTESNLTRLQIVIRTDNKIPKVDCQEIEDKIAELSRSWIDDFKHEVSETFDRNQSKIIIENYQNSFTVSYSHRFKPSHAIHDIGFVNKALESKNGIVFSLYRSSLVADDTAEIKIYNVEKKLELSDIMPILDSFGFNIIHEHTYLISPKNSKEVWVHYFNVNLSKLGDKLTPQIIKNFEETIDCIYQGKAQVGHLNIMVISANLNNRQISLLRFYSKYLYQAGFRYSQKYIANSLVKYRDITKLIIELFETKFNPANNKNREQEIVEISAKIMESLSAVSDSTDDLILRRFLNIVEATIRTNFFQKDANGDSKDYISCKFNPAKIHDLVLPVPYAEIFVFSNDVEGVHLRGGKVARGGLRWSDRHEDFRTEVLGLVKAQMTKNAVIVPVGSKGGFVVKTDTSGMNREQFLQTGINCYKTFLRGLLDLTDNVVDGKVVHPNDVVRYDESDPYLVVAADKGTATFSDIANSISAEYNFWLGDAFASGGSVGYDHKKMGITAKGAWISVKRHFSEMGIDTQSHDFTCVGIGDLSGDVFGNGMLLSKHIKLVAAFNHLHIFLDPNPDTQSSYKERERMFNLPRSSWMDYDQKLISQGGGIFERSAKIIQLSEEVRKVLEIEKTELTPDELIKAILKAPVDLLFNGGIGTYVKSTTETDLDVGDRVNDTLRINGSELRCKVVGEGGNLGFTQRGRIEYALNGGRINTDAMDNSAGVDCSDHEVNIKIALTQAMKSGKVSLKKRNEILEAMTNEVEHLVLNDNIMQTQAITVSQSKGAVALGDQARFLSRLEKIGLLNREVEFLPTQKQIEKRQSEKSGMTRPELCVMLAYSKMDLYNNLTSSSLVKDPFFEKMLLNYFPKILQKEFRDEILKHQLRSEIIATQITNLVVGRLGISFVNQIATDNGFQITDIVRSIIVVCESFRLEEIWNEIESLDGTKVPVEIQVRMFLATTKLVERSCLWLLRNAKSKDIEILSNNYRVVIDQIFANLDNLLAQASKESYDQNINAYQKCGVDKALAKKIAAMDPLGSAYDIIEVSKKTGLEINDVSQIYFKVGTRLNLKWLRTKIISSTSDNYWQRVSVKTILEDLYNYQMAITYIAVSHNCKGKKPCDIDSALENWIESESFLIERYDIFIEDFKSQVNPDLSMFIVAMNRIKALVSKI